MTATEPTISIELTERQQSVTIDALYDKSAETDRYLSSYRGHRKARTARQLLRGAPRPLRGTQRPARGLA
ncbi:hypothetical protein OHB41_08895 [Streptomyces sp. NBC_01571]|uniref:hypothetical protein n=1 Tax=Streptomyces sp. NBC_01571 TaxID=2975883 RepID=UPI0022576B6F|nr:hypothetical protein [Streptomyces sp. NBC_01571]MCX4573295.1 hypothetical protein [Streptomyces sp. NBC_01571]